HLQYEHRRDHDDHHQLRRNHEFLKREYGPATPTSPPTVHTFSSSSTAANSTITTNNGGKTLFDSASIGGLARFVTNVGGLVDISFLSSGGLAAGSIEGAGPYDLGSQTLTVGGHN